MLSVIVIIVILGQITLICDAILMPSQSNVDGKNGKLSREKVKLWFYVHTLV